MKKSFSLTTAAMKMSKRHFYSDALLSNSMLNHTEHVTLTSWIMNPSPFFFCRIFFHSHWRFTGQQRKGGDPLLFYSITSTRSQTMRHLFAILHVRWLSRISNRNGCVYQTATRWDLLPYPVTSWLVDLWCNVCLFTWWVASRF